MDWDSGLFVMLVTLMVPLVIDWTRRLANKNSEDGTTFRPAPTLRALYPGMSMAIILLEYFFAKELWDAKRLPGVMDCVAMAGCVSILLICVFTWPPTLYATPMGLRWRRLFSRRLIPWDQIVSAYSGADGDMVIFTAAGQRYEVSQYVQGRTQLKAVIKKKLTALRGPDVCVR
jgi:hypothetical protein